MFVKYFHNKSIPYSPLNEFDPLFDENNSSMVSIERHNNYTENRDSDEESDNCWDDEQGRALLILLMIWSIICAGSVIAVHINPQLTGIDILFFMGPISVIFLIFSSFIACA